MRTPQPRQATQPRFILRSRSVALPVLHNGKLYRQKAVEVRESNACRTGAGRRRQHLGVYAAPGSCVLDKEEILIWGEVKLCFSDEVPLMWRKFTVEVNHPLGGALLPPLSPAQKLARVKHVLVPALSYPAYRYSQPPGAFTVGALANCALTKGAANTRLVVSRPGGVWRVALVATRNIYADAYTELLYLYDHDTRTFGPGECSAASVFASDARLSKKRETAIDSARRGHIKGLLRYCSRCDVAYPWKASFSHRH